FGSFNSSGVDLQVDARFLAGGFTLRPSLAGTQTLEYKTALVPDVTPRDALGHAFTEGVPPQWKGSATLDVGRGAVGVWFTERYVGTYIDYDFFGSLPTNRRIGGDWYTDAFVRWNLDRMPGGADLQSGYLQLAVTNLFDLGPQFSTFDLVGYDPSQYDIRGR